MAITIFATLGNQLEQAVNTATDGLQSTYMSDMAMLATAGGTLYVLFYGYCVLAGKIDSPLSDFAWNITRMCLIMAFVTNAGGLLTAASNAVTGLQTFATHGQNLWSVLDVRANNIVDLINKVWKAADGVEQSVLAILKIVGLFPLILGVAAIAKELAFAQISLTILIVVMPIFIFCLMYGFLKQMFSKYLTLILVNVFKILFISVLSDVAFRIMAYVTDDNSNLQDFSTALMYVFGGLLAMSVASLGSEIAQALAETSIERAVAGKLGAAAQSAGNMANNGLRAINAGEQRLSSATQNAARSAASTARAAQVSGKGIGGQAGAVAMKAAQATPIGRVGVGVAKAVVGKIGKKAG